MDRDAKLNDLIRLKQPPSAPLERWQMVPTLRYSTKSGPTSTHTTSSTLQQISTNIPPKSCPKTPELSGRLVMKYKKTPKDRGQSPPPPPHHHHQPKPPCKTPKTPGLQHHKTPKSNKKTPGNAQTPSSCRFIPNRATTDMEYSSFLVQKRDRKEEEKGKEDGSEEANGGRGDVERSPGKEEYQQELLGALSRSRGGRQRGVLSFKPSTPSVSNSYLEYTEDIERSSCTKPKKSGLSVAISTEKILDAPTIMDDYYLNNLDWGKNNHVAIGLGPGVYIWNASDGSVKMLTELSGEQYVCSVSWSSNGKFLAVGGSNGSIYLWDIAKEKKIRVMKGHSSRVGAMSWNKYTVASGSEDGSIIHNDVRKQDHLVARSIYHQHEVCGLKWSPDGTKLASGANDNMVCIWSSGNLSQPAQILRGHQSAVKAVAWCPWQPNTLATGGGSNDKTIKFWNTHTGQCTSTVETGSQVSSLAWNKDHKQLLSAHGYPKNHMIVWQYPNMTRLGALTGHSERILHMCLSPRMSRVASAAGDETLRIWKCFERLRCDISQRSYSEESITTLLHSFS